MVEAIFELGINLAETLIIIDFVTQYLGCKYQDRLKIIGLVSAWFAAFTELSIVNRIAAFEGIGTIIPIVIYFIHTIGKFNVIGQHRGYPTAPVFFSE